LDGLVLPGDDLLERARGRGGDLRVDLVGGDLEQGFVDLDRVALLLDPAGDGALAGGFTASRRLYGEGHYVVTPREFPGAARDAIRARFKRRRGWVQYRLSAVTSRAADAVARRRLVRSPLCPLPRIGVAGTHRSGW